MGSYSLVSLCALMCYILLFSIFFAAKKDRILVSFLHILGVLIVWTGGSLLMRVRAVGNMGIWFHISLIAIWMSCFALIHFMRVFSDSKCTLTDVVLQILATVMLSINCLTGFFLAPPEVVFIEGNATFIYNMHVGTYFMYAFLLFMALYTLRVTFSCYASNVATKEQFTPIILGVLIMFGGQVIIMLPVFKGIPLDIASGVVCALCLFYALYECRLFTLTLAFSRRTYCLVTASILIIISIFFASSFQEFIIDLGGFAAKNSPAIMIMVGVIMAIIIYLFVKLLSENLFLSEEKDRSAALKIFSDKVSRSLHVDDICQQLCSLIRENVPRLSAITIAVEDNKETYRVSASSSVMRVGHALFHNDHPVVQWCNTHPSGGKYSDFKYSIEYKSMWEEEKQQMQELNPDYIFPLLDTGELIGIVFISEKDKIRGLHSDDIGFISSADTVASISIKNSRMYEKACQDARTDDLTGLLNRKYFMQELNELLAKEPGRLLSLAIINLDDFKLYNQLYGTAEGDKALCRVANILKHNAGENTIVARYSGKEFALLMPGQETASAVRMAESLRQQIFNMNRIEGELGEHMMRMSIITCSIGICSIPFGASNAKQLLENADMTVYQIKKSGKNAVKVFSAGQENVGSELKAPLIDHKKSYSELEQTIYALTATVDAKDHYTFAHSNDVAYYAMQLAEAYGLNEDTVEMIRQAALLHDIGKIGIPESILNKPGRLTDEEYEIIKKHPENAVAIIRHLPNLDYIIPAVISHHERWDGKGYPRRIGGEDIPLSGRILCLADSFDAMTGRRCYQDGRVLESALQDIEINAGKQFDPVLAKLFVEKIRDGSIKLKEQVVLGKQA